MAQFKPPAPNAEPPNLLGAFLPPQSPAQTSTLSTLFGGLPPMPHPPALNAEPPNLGAFLPPQSPAQTSTLSTILGGLSVPDQGSLLCGSLRLNLRQAQSFRSVPEPPKKRRAFFSFHFDDVMRVNVVRQAWRFSHPEVHSFTDSSLWEKRRLEGDEALKALIRGGVQNTSAVCVLIGSDTWSRRWVRYEIARAIIDQRGLLGVHLNGIRHHRGGVVDARGLNPLAFLAVGKAETNSIFSSAYYLFERKVVTGPAGPHYAWLRYNDYTRPVKRPTWLPDCAPGYVTPLSDAVPVYDYAAEDGHQKLGTWIDNAARRSGR